MNKMCNMLSAKKVKLHGMTSDKWTTKDKITQYKGLINLYKRDRKIIDMDTNVNKKKQAKQLKELQKDIENNRSELDNAIRGDKQQLRNTLAEHREMQLAYQNSPPKKVIENIHQINFNKRKELDRLEYCMNKKNEKLIALKLELAELEDRVKYEGPGEIPIEKSCAIITGKVQDAILKKEAALAIKHTFIQIIDIMKKDALYFDAILMTLRCDFDNQGTCMISATKLGQLATEYLDDRRKEYKTLEKAVKKDMQMRKRDLTLMQQKIQNAAANIKQLIRRDSDINLGFVKIEKTDSEIELKTDLEKIEDTLKELKTNTYVADYESIYPCFKAQMTNSHRLTELAHKCEESRDILLKKANHAEVMRDVLRNSMVETTFEYKEEKKNLLETIDSEQEKKRKANDLLKNKTDLLAKVRLSLRQLQQMSKLIRAEGEKHISSRFHDEDDETVRKPDTDEIDGVLMIQELEVKLKRLMSQDKSAADPQISREDEIKNYETMIVEKCRLVPLLKKVSDESLIEGLSLEITNVPTREDIKKQSQELVDQNTKSDDMAPASAPANKTKKKFKK